MASMTTTESATGRATGLVAGERCPRCGGGMPSWESWECRRDGEEDDDHSEPTGAVSRTDSRTMVCVTCSGLEAHELEADGAPMPRSRWAYPELAREHPQMEGWTGGPRDDCLRAEDLGRRKLVAVVTAVAKEPVVGILGYVARRLVLELGDKGSVAADPADAMVLALAFGEDPAGWVGRRVRVRRESWRLGVTVEPVEAGPARK